MVSLLKRTNTFIWTYIKTGSSYIYQCHCQWKNVLISVPTKVRSRETSGSWKVQLCNNGFYGSVLLNPHTMDPFYWIHIQWIHITTLSTESTYSHTSFSGSPIYPNLRRRKRNFRERIRSAYFQYCIWIHTGMKIQSHFIYYFPISLESLSKKWINAWCWWWLNLDHNLVSLCDSFPLLGRPLPPFIQFYYMYFVHFVDYHILSIAWSVRYGKPKCIAHTH